MDALSVAGMDHQRRPQADRHHVHPVRDGHAAARLCGCDHDAVAAGACIPLRRLSAARALRPDLFGPWHADDLLCRNAFRNRADEPRDAAATRNSRRGISDVELSQFLADGHRRAAGEHLAGRRRVRAYRMAAVSAAVGNHLLAWRRRRLLPLVVADLRRGDFADRGQFRHHGTEAACAGHDLYADAGVLLDHAGLQSADRRCFSGADRDFGDAAAGSLPGVSFLHQ